MAYSLLTDCMNAFSNHFFLLCFSSGTFSVGLSSKSKLDRKYDSKESHCINALSKHFPRLNHLVETLITFQASLMLKFMNSLNWSFRFAFPCESDNIHVFFLRNTFSKAGSIFPKIPSI